MRLGHRGVDGLRGKEVRRAGREEGEKESGEITREREREKREKRRNERGKGGILEGEQRKGEGATEGQRYK
jgi:hypothetical protein